MKKKSSRKSQTVTNYAAASHVTGLPVAAIRALKNFGGSAFDAGNRIHCGRLLQDAAEHPALVDAARDLPDIRVEKALKARADRQLAEIELHLSLQTIAPLEKCRRIVMRAGLLMKQKVMAIPDRTCERISLMTDAAKIREMMIDEITGAMRSLSEDNVEKLIKDVLAE